MLNPYVLIGLLVGAILLFGIGGRVGYKYSQASWQTEKNQMIADSVARQQAEAKVAFDRSVKLENDNAKSKAAYRKLSKLMDDLSVKPEYRNVCFTDDGVQYTNTHITGENTDTGKSGATVSKPSIP